MAKILFRVDKEGIVHVEVDGVEGQLCEDLTLPFEEALGVKIDSQRKPAFYVELDELTTELYETEE